MPVADPRIIRDPGRVQKLRHLELLDTLGGPEFDRLTRLAAKITKAPISLVSLVDADRQYFLSQVGLTEPYATKRETPIDDSFCQHVVGTNEPLIVENAREHPLVFDRSAISDLGFVAYAGMPLITSDGYTLGSFCVADYQPRHWTDDELEILIELAKSVITEIELRSELRERERIEASLRENEQFTRKVINAIPYAVYIVDLEQKRIVFANEHVDRALVESSDYSELAYLIHPDDLPALQQFVNRPMPIHSDEQLEIEFRHSDGAGGWRWQHLQASTFTQNASGATTQIIGVVHDISQRKQMEEVLRENHYLLQGVMDATPDAIYIYDLVEQRNVFAGREIFHLLGYTQEQMEQMGDQFLQIVIDPDDMQRMQPHFEQLAQAKSGEVLEWEYRMKHADGSWRWVSSRDTVFKHEPDGTVRHVIGVARDITERKQVEEAARESEQRLRVVVSNAPLVLFSTDRDGVITLSVGKALKAWEREQNESVGKNIFDLFSDYKAVTTQVQRALAGETVVRQIEFPNAVYDGWYSPIYDDEGTINGMIGVSIDITERVRAERALQNTLQQLIKIREIETELSYSLSLEHVLNIASETVLRITDARHGYIGLFDSGEIHIVHAIGEYQRNTKLDATTGIVGRVVRSRTAKLVSDVTTEPDYIPRIADTRTKMVVPLSYGERFIGIVNLESPLPNQFPSEAFEFVQLIVGQLTLAIDNAQLYEVAQSQLADMAGLYTRVSELEQLKTDIIRIAAHDLRNPLSQVLGYGSLMLETLGQSDGEMKNFTEEILKAGRRMERLITDILSLQRIEAMSSGEHQKVVDLSGLIEDAFTDYEARAQQKAQTFSLTMPETSVQIKGDSAQLREAVDNLIGNAIKYTPEKGSIDVCLAVDDEGKAIFEVRDSGYGIPDQQQARLFQPFYRAKLRETAHIDGTGLGLHLVKNIIERHQGKMRFSSTYGKGSIFGFEVKTV